MDSQNNSNQGQQNQSPNTAPIPEVNNRTLFGILSYLGILVIIPLLMKKNDPFVKFHIKQGLVLLSIEVIIWIVGRMVWSLWPLYIVINIALLVLSIIGIINVVQKKEKLLPLVGGLASYFRI